MADPSIERLSTPYGVFDCWVNDLISRQLHKFGAHTRNELAMLREFVQPGYNILDVGAHIGTFAIPFARFIDGNGAIFAFEANSDNFKLLCKNVIQNGFDRAIFPQCAIVFDRESNFQMLSPDSGNTGAFVFLPSSSFEQNPPVVRLDEWCDERGDDIQFNLVKIDVEGAELSVLRSARRLIDRSHPVLYIEINQGALQRFGVTVDQIEGFLTRSGYEMFQNTGERNSPNDTFQLRALGSLSEGGTFFDVLAIHDSSPLKVRATSLMQERP